ncbi:protein of unknown function [Modestobacter italicus]|uniref:Uncharacterized protein n=1 Tax=Modestobacter italicus (strain DSM 44449 / CECT 9708 / BC 501) TaxID=2732864 RepID=I4ETG4_MODI5|nr:hypothetical protein [Modestobacter marinus]CCH86677.1 protein of unknown function [Modestobacter marinus]
MTSIEPVPPDGTPDEEGAAERVQRGSQQGLTAEEVADIEARMRPRARGPQPPASRGA